MARSRWQNRLIVIGILALPVVAFFVIQVLAARAQPGQLLSVRLVTAPDGNPVAVGLGTVQAGARIKMMDGSVIDREVKQKNRLVQLDLRRGEWLAREPVSEDLELFAVTEAAFWFRTPPEGTDPHPRDAATLKRQPGNPPVPSRSLPPKPAPLVGGFTLPSGERVEAAALAGDRMPGAQLLFDERTGGPFDAEPGARPGTNADTGTSQPGIPSEWILVSNAREGRGAEDVVLVARVDREGKELWRARLALQRHVWGATRVKDSLVIVTGGAARDFAFSLSLADGKVEWVHGF